MECEKVLRGEDGRDCGGVVWNAYCSGCKMGVFLQEFTWIYLFIYSWLEYSL